jgi:site-specific recombinase XerC
MSVADAIATYRDRLESNSHIKPRTKAYYAETLAALVKSWPSLAQTDTKRISEADCRNWASRFFRQFSENRANNTLMVLRDLFYLAIEAGVLYSNPARGKKGKGARERSDIAESQGDSRQLHAAPQNFEGEVGHRAITSRKTVAT